LESDNGIVIDYWQGKWGHGDGDVFLGGSCKIQILTYVGISTQDNVDSRTNANVPSRIGADNRCHNHQQQSRLSLFLNLAAAITTSSTTAAALPSPPPAQQQPAADAAAVATTTPASSATKHLSSTASAADDHLSSLPHLQPQLFAHHLTLFDHHQQPTPSHQQQQQEQHNKQQQQTTTTTS
jgi:hypothetical protein